MKKKSLAIMMAAAMCAEMLAGCGAAQEENTAGSSAQAAADTSGGSAAVEGESSAEGDSAVSADAAEESAADDTSDEITTIDLYTIDFNGGVDDSQVEEKVNEITEKEIGVHVNLNMIDFSSYLQQVSLMLSGDENADVILVTPVPPTTYASMTSQHQLMDLTDLIPEYAPDAYKVMEKYWDSVKVNGSIYGFPIECGMATNAYIAMRQDILDALDLTKDAQNMKSWSDFEAIMQKVYEANQNGTLPEDLQTNAVICNTNTKGSVFSTGMVDYGTDDFAGNFCIDQLGDSYGIIEVDPETKQIIPYYGTDSYYTMLERVTDWYQKGYVYKDASIDQNGGDTLMTNGVTFSYIGAGQINFEKQKEKVTGRDLFTVSLVEEPMGTQVGQTWDLAVPVSSEEPEAAVKFINQLYCNTELINLLVWGVEGVDYNLNEEGEAVTIDNAPYVSQNFIWGDSLLAYPAEGMGSDNNEKLMQEDETREMFPDFGFVPDTSSISGELTAANNVISQYRAILESGSAGNLKETYDDYCAAMEAAGVQKIIDTYQEQLDAFRAAKEQ